jgi:streptomycin 3"-adenylyltransferase
MTASLPVEIALQLSQARAVLERQLTGNLQAIHLFGSAVDGELKPHSDIDLMVTVSNALTDPVRRSLMMDLLSVSGSPATDGPSRPLEVTLVVRSEVVPWRYPPLRELQFGEWLREKLQAGIIPPATLDHDLAILLTKVRQHSVCMAGPPAAELFDHCAVERRARLAGRRAQCGACTRAHLVQRSHWRNCTQALGRRMGPRTLAR